MLPTTLFPSHPARHRQGRRYAFAAASALLATTALLAVPGLASADTSKTLTVVGTSDVSDSGLMTTVIQTAFNNAYHQDTFF